VAYAWGCGVSARVSRQLDRVACVVAGVTGFGAFAMAGVPAAAVLPLMLLLVFGAALAAT
jgi:hypothetical protein